MTLISKGYKKQLHALHEKGDFGGKGDKWAPKVEELYAKYKCGSALDYGSGQMKLARALPKLRIACYDPAVPGYDKEPKPADLVICSDVLEHIEPEYIENVMAHIRSLTQVVFFAVIGMEPAMKTLPDGRNAHVLLRSRDWWLDMLGRHKFAIDDVTEKGTRSLVVVARPC